MNKPPENYVGTLEAGRARPGLGCMPHNNPANYVDYKVGSITKTFCKVCGAWIGNRHSYGKKQETGVALADDDGTILAGHA